MSHRQKVTLAAQVVKIQRRVGELPLGNGFGWTPIGVPGEFTNWLDVVRRDLTGNPAPYVRQLAPALDSLRTYLAEMPSHPFLDDLTVKNVIVKNGELSGIVDVDMICYGDPLYWLALAETTVMLDVGESGSDYSAELRRLWISDEQGERALELYKAIFSAYFLGRNLDPSVNTRMRCFFECSLSQLASPGLF